jgi:hypothetical protein
MKKNKTNQIYLILFLLIMSFRMDLQAQDSENNFYVLANTFFQNNVDENGQVAYESIKNDPKIINQLYEMINSHSLENKTTNELKSFYTNAYNILVIKQVIDSYPIYGPLKVNGFFDKIKHNVADETLTLNQVEKDKNLYVTKDERLHFALVCGAKGCPPLANYAYTPEKIDEQLNERTKYALSDENFIRLNKKNVGISQIFNWYADDFQKPGVNGIVSYLNKYRKNQIQMDTKIVYYEYNWELNKQ